MEFDAMARMPVFLLVEWDWFPSDDLFLIEFTDLRRLVRGYLSELEAQSAALSAFDKFADHWGGKSELYYEDPRTLAQNWKSLLKVGDQYQAMVECLRIRRDNRSEHPYGTLYEVEKMYLPPEAWNLSPPFPVFVVGKTRLAIGQMFDPLRGYFSTLSVHVDALQAQAEAVSQYEDHVSRTGQGKPRDVIEGWGCMDSMQRYKTMLAREEGRDLKESDTEFGVIFPLLHTVVMPAYFK